jgi:hypothetical protein
MISYELIHYRVTLREKEISKPSQYAQPRAARIAAQPRERTPLCCQSGGGKNVLEPSPIPKSPEFQLPHTHSDGVTGGLPAEGVHA